MKGFEGGGEAKEAARLACLRRLAAGVPFFHDQFGRWRQRFAELG